MGNKPKHRCTFVLDSGKPCGNQFTGISAYHVHYMKRHYPQAFAQLQKMAEEENKMAEVYKKDWEIGQATEADLNNPPVILNSPIIQL